MSKERDTQTYSNVQGEPVEGRVLLSVPIDRVVVDPDQPNIRGQVVNTTDLQDSIRENGILVPLQVRLAPDQPGYFFRITGNRRQVAARAVGLEYLPVIVNEDVTERDVRRMMLMSDLHKAEPHIVLGGEGEVIAGKCRAVYEEIMDEESDMSRQDLAASMGVSSDVIGAYVCLHDDIPEIQRKIARDQMAITAYSLVKHHGPEIKLFLAQKRGNVSANYVRRTLRDWDSRIAPQLEGVQDIEGFELIKERENIEPVEAITDSEDRVRLVMRQRMTINQLLNGALDRLNRIVVSGSALSGTDWAIVDQIDTLLERIKNEDK
jgi:ParB/RepB/Spo0J family partition protein